MKVTIHSKTTHLRRAGLEFTRAGVEIDTDELTPEQAEAINAEPLLVISGDDLKPDPDSEIPGKVQIAGTKKAGKKGK